MSAICDLNPVLLKYAVMLQAYKQREPGKLVPNRFAIRIRDYSVLCEKQLFLVCFLCSVFR